MKSTQNHYVHFKFHFLPVHILINLKNLHKEANKTQAAKKSRKKS